MKSADYLQNIPKLNAIRMLFWMHFFAAVLIPFFEQWGGLTLAQIMFLNAWFMLWNLILEIPTGALADRIGRKASILLGSIVGIVAVLAYLSRPALSNFLVAEIIFAFSFTLQSGADEALAYDSLAAANATKNAQIVIARMETWKLAGIIIATLTGGFIATRWGLTAPLRALIIPLALSIPIALTLQEPPHLREGSPKNYFQIIKRGAKLFLGHQSVRRLTFDMVTVNALIWTIIWFCQPLLLARGMSIEWLGFVQAAGCLGQVLFLRNLERIQNFAGTTRKLLLFQAVATALCFCVLGASRHLGITIAAVVLAYSFGLSRPAVFAAHLNSCFPSSERATILSFISACRTLAIVLINPVAGWLADRSLPLAMLVLGALALLAGTSARAREIDFSTAKT